MKSPIPYFSCLIVYFLLWLNIVLNQHWLLIFFTFVVFPILENILPFSKSNDISNSWVYSVVCYLQPVCQTIAIFLSWEQAKTLSLINLVLYSISLGIANGSVGITVAHENIHAKYGVRKLLGIWNLMCVNYPHFYVEHLFGHHVNVGTHNDPATARKNESLYTFLYRSITQSFASAIEIESSRNGILVSRGFMTNNYLFWSWSITLLLSFLCFGIFGIKALCVHTLSSIVSIFLLETINYIEHYGLVRNPNTPVNKFHSWNTNTIIGNYFLFKLQRHSDHHTHSTKSYQNLVYETITPCLPSGYATCILFAMVPCLWFRIMNEKIEKLKKLF